MSDTLQEQRQELESQLPEHLKGAISYYAYEQGHAYGQHEVDLVYVDLATAIIDALKKDGLIK